MQQWKSPSKRAETSKQMIKHPAGMYLIHRITFINTNTIQALLVTVQAETESPMVLSLATELQASKGFPPRLETCPKIVSRVLFQPFLLKNNIKTKLLPGVLRCVTSFVNYDIVEYLTTHPLSHFLSYILSVLNLCVLFLFHHCY